MDEFIEEIKEDIQQERLEKIWKKYGNHIISAVVGIVALTGAYVYWGNYQDEKHLEESDRYAKALKLASSNKTQEALSLLSDLEENGGSYHGLAALQKAAGLGQGSKQDMIKAYESLSKDRSLDLSLRNLAAYLSVLHQMDTQDPKVLMEKLAPLMIGSNPWSTMVSELTAILALKAGDKNQAISIYTELLENKGTPNGIKMRARAMLSQLKQG